jgi:hypothetical protein
MRAQVVEKGLQRPDGGAFEIQRRATALEPGHRLFPLSLWLDRTLALAAELPSVPLAMQLYAEENDGWLGSQLDGPAMVRHQGLDQPQLHAFARRIQRVGGVPRIRPGHHRQTLRPLSAVHRHAADKRGAEPRHRGTSPSPGR